MKKNDEIVEKRSRFIKLSLQHPKHAAAKLRALAIQIESSKTVAERYLILEDILFLSERTLRG